MPPGGTKPGAINDPSTNTAQQNSPTSQLTNVTPTQQQPVQQPQQQFPNFQPYFQQMHGGMDELSRALQQMESMQMPGQQYTTQPYVVSGQTAGKGVGF